jgi:hypothetical protein
LNACSVHCRQDDGVPLKRQPAQRNAARIRDCPRNSEGDFGFWIWDCGFKNKSQIRNPKSKIEISLELCADCYGLNHIPRWAEKELK